MSDTNLNRRQFAKSLAAGAVVSSLADDRVVAEEKPKPAVAADKPRDREKDAATPEANHALAIIKSRYPHPKLTPDVLQHIRDDIVGDQSRAKSLRTVPLSNGDEPAFVFTAYRADAIR